jgi:hypothetical protein
MGEHLTSIRASLHIDPKTPAEPDFKSLFKR